MAYKFQAFEKRGCTKGHPLRACLVQTARECGDMVPIGQLTVCQVSIPFSLPPSEWSTVLPNVSFLASTNTRSLFDHWVQTTSRDQYN